MSYVPSTITSKEDIDKQIEIETANLMYFEYKNKAQALKEATTYIQEKYKVIIEDLKQKGQY